jgi:3-oxoacyl-[acyl-carrier-protein] synthase II
MGAVSALGSSVPSLWSAIDGARCGIATIGRFDTGELTVHTGALVDNARAPSSRGAHELCRDFAVRAAREAIVSAGLDGSRARTALLLGTGLVGDSASLDALVEAVAEALGIEGVRFAVSTACSSSTGALAIGCELLALGAADAVLAGGADVLTPEVFAGFHALGVLTTGACAPFSLPPGTTLGEGAGFVVLERAASARTRGVRARAGLAGYGLSADAWHETSPDPRGAGIERAIRSALADAGLPSEEVGYVNAHGSGTQANDFAEWLGISRALGPGRRTVPVSSTKGALGHAQGACGVLEAIVTIEGMSRGLLPPTLNFVGPRPNAPPDPVPGPWPRPASCRSALSVNSAFGGANAALVLSRHVRSAPAATRRPVMLRGVGVQSSSDAVEIETLVPGAESRGLDPASKLLTASAALALRDGELKLAGERRNRCGLTVGQCRPSLTSLRAFSGSIGERGLARVSAFAFARIVLNAAAGFCSKLLGVRGPLTVLSAGPASGLAAVVLAAQWLATREDAGLMLASSVDEDGPGPGGSGHASTGAVSLLLEADEGHDSRSSAATHPAVTVAGWGLAAPGRRDEAAAHAAPAGVAKGALLLETSAREGQPVEGLFLMASAVLALREGVVRGALVTSDPGQELAAAVHLVT